MSKFLFRWSDCILTVLSVVLVFCTAVPVLYATDTLSADAALQNARIIGNMTVPELLALTTLCSVGGMLGLFWLRERTAQKERCENIELTKQNAALSQRSMDALAQNSQLVANVLDAIKHCEAMARIREAGLRGNQP